jgi:hypothetical protein
MRDRNNPFALVRASDYSVEQINALWVELGSSVVESIIEPESRTSIFILGSKGTGKTHLLRYHSYPAVRMRSTDATGLATIVRHKFLGIFIRATTVDAGRFEPSAPVSRVWQQLFGVYFELSLVSGVLDALIDIKNSSPTEKFDDAGLILRVSRDIHNEQVAGVATIEELKEWVDRERRAIDDAVNNAAFTGELSLRVAFAIGGLSIPLSQALPIWHPAFLSVPLLYLIDEIENFTQSQQEVINSLVRYGEGLTSFRLTGRRYSLKTRATVGGGEENREGTEFKTRLLDDILRSFPRYADFARRFVAKRLMSTAGAVRGTRVLDKELDPRGFFNEIDASDCYSDAIATLGLAHEELVFKRQFAEMLIASEPGRKLEESALEVTAILTTGFPVLLQKLNLLLFCKKMKRTTAPLDLARALANDARAYMNASDGEKSAYATAYGHWASDLFAQLCRESKKQQRPIYAGFDTFVKMSSGNPRNLLIILGRAYEIAAFRELDFISGPPLSLGLQTEAAIEAARFMFERDTNYGSQADHAREGVARLASLLRTARFAINIPEVSPLAISFADADLTSESRQVLDAALNYSLLFEIVEGRPDRNSQQLHRKIQLNPLLSPRWGLPVSRRGDIGLSGAVLNAVLSPKSSAEFDAVLRLLSYRWNFPFRTAKPVPVQTALF